ncbi:hypothetical protein B0A55_05197 [Friedmanniomyces simplex]|uniref:Peptidase M48 domain-containing protein n=1 Tax=Friedmanniomyces simplex TaxID=329884 RepID=A0A4U0XH95_9PEZI|nr:hypothetical protein B0A55_05197 [Friedmanniomyces simplex]
MYQQTMQEFGSKLMSPDSREHRMVQRVMNRLIPHSGLAGEEWEVHVIDDPMQNAFVIPGGKVFVFRGILDVAQGDDGLAAVLGHEVAHNVAHHAAERMSQGLPVLVLLLLLWGLGLDPGFGNMALNLAFTLPGSRKQEQEADYIGLMMMSESCYDPRAAMGLWSRMEQEEKAAPPQFLSTHPSSHNRLGLIEGWLPKAEQELEASDCGMLTGYESGLITKAYERKDALPQTINEPDIDLRGLCVLPGLVDAHTHILLHAYSEASSTAQMRDESLVERIIRATNHCRAALLAGFTTYRDLGTEGAYDADVHIRNAVNRGLIPGPRIYCVSEALASSGGYETRHENAIGGSQVPRISDPCDGVVGVRAAVRRRLGAGADLIKFYADYRKRALRFPGSSWPGCPEIMFPPPQEGLQGDRNPNLLLFDQDEMDAIVAEAKTARAPVAAHASTAEAVTMAAKAGVTTVEHGFLSMEGSEAMQTMREKGTIFVPTLAVLELFASKNAMKDVLAQVKKAYDTGVKLACGGDTGTFAHGDNARELELFLEAGIPLEELLYSATVRGWEACGGDWCGRGFGWIEEGVAADFVGLGADVRKDVGALRNVKFVMKDARVWKSDGQAVSMI